MTKTQRMIFWIVAALTAAVSISGIGYAFLAVSTPLRVTIFGNPFPAWMLGTFVAAWGAYTGYRLYRIFVRTAGLRMI
jgi:hypothetical protein